jgi:hypothetical protein
MASSASDDVESLDWDSIVSEMITPEFCHELLQNDFAMRDAAFLGVAERLRSEAHELYENGGMKEHTFQFGGNRMHADGRPILFRKPHIYEADMHDPGLAEADIRAFRGLFHSGALPQAFAKLLPELRLVCDTRGVTIKLQKNNGNGGSFAHHYDNPGPPNKRALTCLLYLNESWKEGDGGELELQPMFKAPVVVAPTMAKFVVFRSDRVLHRVRPAVAPRLCFTVWIDGEAVNGPDQVNLKAKHIDLSAKSTTHNTAIEKVHERAAFLAKSPLQRVLSRALYANEYEASLRECMLEPQGVGPLEVQAANAMLVEHAARVKALRANPALAAFIDSLQEVVSTGHGGAVEKEKGDEASGTAQVTGEPPVASP